LQLTMSSGSIANQAIEKAMANWPVLLGLVLVATAINEFIVYSFYTSPLANVPGPKMYAVTKWWMVWTYFTNKRTKTIHKLHQKYGPVVRVGPNELVFSGQEPMKVIYGAGAVFSKTEFYNLFVAYSPCGVQFMIDTTSVQCLPC
jgi:hypothetical protein